MRKRTWLRSSSFRSDNRKSKIENEGIVAIGVTFAMYGAVAQAQQQPTKVHRVGHLGAGSASSESARTLADPTVVAKLKEQYEEE